MLIDRELPPSVRASARPVRPSRRDAGGGRAPARRSGTDASRWSSGSRCASARERRHGARGRVRGRAACPPTYRVAEGAWMREHGRSATRGAARRPGPADRAHRRRQPAPRRRARRADRAAGSGSVEDLSLVSCDATPLTRLTVPPIAVVRARQPRAGPGRGAASAAPRRAAMRARISSCCRRGSWRRRAAVQRPDGSPGRDGDRVVGQRDHVRAGIAEERQ